ncbi:hypothetical protein [Dyadobacter arcticus]|uniref:Helix-turn-helix domain-containing protein n=1 Tax=Dyadobacter arcticus TaxID=1078754 RepID=A0ABX0UPV2_9BACT|nr:hypothetical protein [Dyadobacter arcticus]NIJ55022.1 hypothetical protein [Dyadobacter arcticus]
METKDEFRARILTLMDEADEAIKIGSEVLIRKGHVMDLTEWVTIKEYCRRFDVKNTETVSNWIKRGIIPADDTMVIEEFNNIRMIRAKIYKVSETRSA